MSLVLIGSGLAIVLGLCAELIETAPVEREPLYGMCTACGSVEVELDRVNGYRDLSRLGESNRYPYGYGCEVRS